MSRVLIALAIVAAVLVAIRPWESTHGGHPLRNDALRQFEANMRARGLPEPFVACVVDRTGRRLTETDYATAPRYLSSGMSLTAATKVPAMRSALTKLGRIAFSCARSVAGRYPPSETIGVILKDGAMLKGR